MNKKKQNKIIVVCALFIGILFVPILLQEFQSHDSEHSFPISLSDLNNHDLLMDVMDGKLSQYNDNGFFSTYYTPSLQGVFYALSSYNTLGNLDLINQTEILNYILTQYDTSSEYFLDPYAVRYLDTDFGEYYLPLNTLLEVNCFAVLALEILGELNQINTQTMVDFIWSCYHPTEGGFIGQPYNASLHNNFRIPTLDNTYFAVKALDVLIEDWNPYTLQKAEIIQFIGECQSMTQSDGFYGGFENDLDPSFDSLDTLDPNLVSSYYALKTLDILNALETVDLDAFHEYLSDMYHPAEYYFDLTWAEIAPSFGIPAATSLGLDLSVLTGFEGVEELEIFNYLNSIQNSIGLWPTSLEYSQFELIDTFQVLRSLNESGYIHYFTPTEKDEIADGLNHFKSYEAYSTTPIDLESVSQIFSVARSFKLFDRETDLAMHKIYSDIRDAYFDPFGKNYRGFYAYTNLGGNYFPFRIYPIEYFNVGNYSSLEYTEHLRNHKTVFHALLALQSLYKLDDFENYYDLSDILNSTLDAQIIESVSEHFGAFLPTNALKIYYQERQDKYIFMDQSYYAVRLLGFLSDYLGLAPIEDLIVDVDALNMFVFDTFESPGEYCYSMPRDTDNVNIILKNTYFASYIMTALDSFTQNTQKIKNYILDHIDYTNLENIYYCWKLDQLLELDIPFQVETVQTLINSLYTEIYYDFSVSTDSPQIKSESLYWICDMAIHDEFRYDISHADHVQLDSNVIITVEIDNLILDGIGDYGSLKFESEQLGVYSFTEVSEGVFKANVFVPLASENYPTIYGNVCRYEYSIKQDQVPISFETEYDFHSEISFIENPTSVDIDLNCSINTAAGSNPLSEGSAYAETYYEGNYLGIELFSILHSSTDSLFSLHYDLSNFGNYSFDFYVNDGLNTTDHFLGTYTVEHTYLLHSEVSTDATAHNIALTINSSLVILGTEYNPIIDGNAYAQIYYDSQFIEQTPFLATHYDNYTLFNLSHEIMGFDEYIFELYVNDGITPIDQFIQNISYTQSYGLHTESYFNTEVEIAEFSLNASILVMGSAFQPLESEGTAFAKIYSGGELLTSEVLQRSDFEDYSLFELEYEFTSFGEYWCDLYVRDGIDPQETLVESYYYNYSYIMIHEVNPSGEVDTISVDLNSSLFVVDSEYQPLLEGSAIVRIYRDGSFIEELLLDATHYENYSIFSLIYLCDEFASYRFETYLSDGYETTDLLVDTYYYEYNYELIESVSMESELDILEFTVNASFFICDTEYRSLPDGQVNMTIFYNGNFWKDYIFSGTDFGTYSLFQHTSIVKIAGNYTFEISLDEGLNQSAVFLKTYIYQFSYEIHKNVETSHISDAIEFFVNASLFIMESEYRPLLSGNAYVKIYRDGNYSNTKQLSAVNYDTYTRFNSYYDIIQSGNYTFQIYLNDGINSTDIFIHQESIEFDLNPDDPDDPDDPGDTENDPDGQILPMQLNVPMVLIPMIASSGVIAFTYYKKKQMPHKSNE